MRFSPSDLTHATYENITFSTEERHFVGRETEQKKFEAFIHPLNQKKKVLHIYGTGGVGKTYLIHTFQRIAEEEGNVFLHLNSLDFIHTPLTLADSILSLVQTKTDITFHESSSLASSLKKLTYASQQKPLIIAIDSYELMEKLDNWFRHMFINQLPASIRFVLASRYPLTGEWEESPAWRNLVETIHLTDFNFDQTRAYLRSLHIQDEQLITNMWRFTKGHPLTLSLAVLAAEKEEGFSFLNHKRHVLTQLTNKWLSEVKEERLQEMVEAAACLRQFDQQSLLSILKKDIPVSLFKKLTSLSFVQKRQHGWALHDLIRDAIKLDLQQRNRDLFDLYGQRSASYYLSRLQKKQGVWEIGEFFYHLGDSFIQSTFFPSASDGDFYLEQVGNHNFSEVKDYFKKRKEQLEESHVQFYDQQTDHTYHYNVSKHHNKIEEKLIDEDYVEKFGHNVARLLKTKDGELQGISIVVPIHQETIGLLAKEPVSKAYFQQLSPREYSAYQTTPSDCSGYFIRMLDCLDATDHAGRSFLLYNLFPLLLSGGHIIASTPLSFFQDLLKSFGFEKVPNATHFDYGDTPSPTYLLNVKGQRLAHYLKSLLQTAGPGEELDVIASSFSFTEREKELAALILQGKSNAEIATSLFLAEVTVKKHIGRMLKKANVKNRVQLMKRMMDKQ